MAVVLHALELVQRRSSGSSGAARRVECFKLDVVVAEEHGRVKISQSIESYAMPMLMRAWRVY